MKKIAMEKSSDESRCEKVAVTRSEDLSGKTIGRWTVLERVPGSGPAKWRCRCQCGTERIVLARSLKAGESLSCGCLNRERVKASQRIDLTGMRFGKLTVEERAEDTADSAWKCLCDCGQECIVLTKSLRSGKRTSCGCASKKGKGTVKDIAGQKFSMITALYPTPFRDRKGSVMWHCICECGNELDVSCEQLRQGDRISCGCMKEKCGQELHTKLIHVAGTSIDLLRSEKKPVRSRTGITGVYLRRGKYTAIITFQSKVYFLGRYARLADAAMVRKEAEETLHKSTVQFYAAWKRKAEENPDWAAENPISIDVTQLDAGRFEVRMSPEIAF